MKFIKYLSLLFILQSLLSTSVFAVTFTPNITTDSTDANPGDGVCADASGDCSLRAATMEANTLGGSNVIELGAGTYELSITGALNPITGDKNSLLASSNLEITGAGASNTLIDGSAVGKVLVVDGAGIDFSMSNIAVSNSVSTPFALINVESSVNDVEFSQMVFESNISSEGVLQLNHGGTCLVENTLFQDNQATVNGGAMRVSANCTISQSTFSGNSSVNGGAIRNDSALIITNSTFYNNSATSRGGAIFNNETLGVGATLNINNSTFFSNLATVNGNSIFNNATGDVIEISNSIVDASDAPSNCSGALFTSNGNNIESGSSCGFLSAGDLQNTDALLGSLADNGGETPTFALALTSPARNAGNNSSCETTDQRGYSRPQATTCDIGSYEARPPTVAFSVATVDFGEITIDESSTAQSVVLSNDGDDVLSLTTIDVEGDFSQSNDCPDTLETGESCTLSLVFNPTTVGDLSGSLSVDSNDLDSPTLLSLTGVGAALPTTPAITTQYQGSSAFGCTLQTRHEEIDSKSLWSFLAMSMIYLMLINSLRKNKILK